MTATSTDLVRVEREKRRTLAAEHAWEREKILYDRILTPNVIRLVLVAAIIAYSTNATRSKENVGPIQSALAFAGPGIGIPLIAADAGIRDRYALAAISAAGTAYAGLSALQGWSGAGVSGGIAGTAVDLYQYSEDPWQFVEDLAATTGSTLQELFSAINPWG